MALQSYTQSPTLEIALRHGPGYGDRLVKKMSAERLALISKAVRSARNLEKSGKHISLIYELVQALEYEQEQRRWKSSRQESPGASKLVLYRSERWAVPAIADARTVKERSGEWFWIEMPEWDREEKGLQKDKPGH